MERLKFHREDDNEKDAYTERLKAIIEDKARDEMGPEYADFVKNANSELDEAIEASRKKQGYYDNEFNRIQAETDASFASLDQELFGKKKEEASYKLPNIPVIKLPEDREPEDRELKVPNFKSTTNNPNNITATIEQQESRKNIYDNEFNRIQAEADASFASLEQKLFGDKKKDQSKYGELKVPNFKPTANNPNNIAVTSEQQENLKGIIDRIGVKALAIAVAKGVTRDIRYKVGESVESILSKNSQIRATGRNVLNAIGDEAQIVMKDARLVAKGLAGEVSDKVGATKNKIDKKVEIAQKIGKDIRSEIKTSGKNIMHNLGEKTDKKLEQMWSPDFLAKTRKLGKAALVSFLAASTIAATAIGFNAGSNEESENTAKKANEPNDTMPAYHEVVESTAADSYLDDITIPTETTTKQNDLTEETVNKEEENTKIDAQQSTTQAIIKEITNTTEPDTTMATSDQGTVPETVATTEENTTEYVKKSVEKESDNFEFEFSEKNPTVEDAMKNIDAILDDDNFKFETDGCVSRALELYAKIGFTENTSCALVGNILQELGDNRALNPFWRNSSGKQIGPYQFCSSNATSFVDYERNNYRQDYDYYCNHNSTSSPEHWGRQFLIETKFFMYAEPGNWNSFLRVGGSVDTQAEFFCSKLERPNKEEAMISNRQRYGNKTKKAIDNGVINIDNEDIVS